MCLLKYWKEHHSVYPFLAKVAITVLGIPASSVPVECLFSIAKKFFRPKRCQLADEIFQKLMFIQHNNKYSK